MPHPDPLATQQLLRDRHPELTNRLDAHDVALLRAVYAARETPHRRRTHMLAGAVGQPRDLTEAQLDRLEREGWLARFNGWSVPTHVARFLGSLLWTCTGCGCTDELACSGGCYWTRTDYCSACARNELLAEGGVADAV